METKESEGEHTPRRRRAPPGHLCLNGAHFYQSAPSVSPPAGVQAANQVLPVMPPETKRTLPSPKPALIPPGCGDVARHMHRLTLPPQVHARVFVAQKVGEGVIKGVYAVPKKFRPPQSPLEEVGVSKVL